MSRPAPTTPTVDFAASKIHFQDREYTFASLSSAPEELIAAGGSAALAKRALSGTP